MTCIYSKQRAFHTKGGVRARLEWEHALGAWGAARSLMRLEEHEQGGVQWGGQGGNGHLIMQGLVIGES